MKGENWDLIFHVFAYEFCLFGVGGLYDKRAFLPWRVDGVGLGKWDACFFFHFKKNQKNIS